MFDLSQKQAFLMVGYPGSGKSTLAKKIAQKFNCRYLSSDEMREKLFQSSRFDQRGDEAIVELRKKVYPLLYNIACQCLRKNQRVVIDATHLDNDMRNSALQQIFKTIDSSKICFIVVNLPFEVVEKRMFKFNNVVNQGNESIYEAWVRLWKYFDSRKERGMLSWPTSEIGIDMIDYQDMYAQLDKS